MYIIIVGSGRVGSQLARLLAGSGHNVVVIDKDPASFKQLGTDFNGLTITGEGFDVDLLKEAGIEQADAFCTVTDNDNANIMSGQVAKKIFHTPKVIARINEVQYAHIYKELGIDTVNSTALLTSMLRNKIMETSSTAFILEDSSLDTIEIEANSKIVGKTIEQLNIPKEFLIPAIIRKKEPSIARPKDRVEPGDVLIGVLRTESLGKVKKLLGFK